MALDPILPRLAREAVPTAGGDPVGPVSCDLVRRQIQPVVGARLPLAEIGSAHRMLERADIAGTIVLVPS